MPTTGPLPIADYALIGDGRTAALVGKNGSLDWLCWPRFDSPACFCALLGSAEQGAWQIWPVEADVARTRCYLGGSMVLETRIVTQAGEVALIDFMPLGAAGPAVVRRVAGLRGRVALRMSIAVRFGYGAESPRWQQHSAYEVALQGKADALTLRSDVPLTCNGSDVGATFDVAVGEAVTFSLHDGPAVAPAAFRPEIALADTLREWRTWSARAPAMNRYRDEVQRSLLVLKSLIYRPTGGIVAAPTTSLPEYPGGARNWDYRYVWLRDSALAVSALVRAGYREEALAWRKWLIGAIGGDAAGLRIMYGLAGEQDLQEREAEWLPGYCGARPVRIGNAAHGQRQWDVFGEVLDACGAIGEPGDSWALQVAMVELLATVWHLPDEGIWETRGGRRRFTFSAVMAWVAFDRAISTATRFQLAAPLARWQAVRAEIHATVCRLGFDPARNSFVQSFGRSDLDASALMLPLVGFLPPNDARIVGTVAAIERDLLEGGFVRRYRSELGADGLPPGEGVFLACSFWLVECYVAQGRRAEAVALFERLLTCANDVGLLAEEYDPVAGRMLGNFPQAFSHLALVNAALALER